MRLAPILVVAALSTSVFTGCSSSEPRENTIRCQRCHRTFSGETAMCSDCAAPMADPVMIDREEPVTPPPADSTPPPRPRPQPQPVRETPPPAQPAPANGPRRAPTAKDAYSIFLNKFPQADAEAVENELAANPDFVDVIPGGGAHGRRVVIECKYVGANLKRDLIAATRKLGLRAIFTEAKLPNQIELVRE